MTHRIDQAADHKGAHFVFQGRMDRPALEALKRLCQARSRQGEKVRVVLGAGTQVETGLMDEILGLEGIELTAESPFLSRMIANPTEDGRKS